ncbi:MAG: HAD family phosphatase [Deltaproteobacteria bacterium]
MMIENIVFDLGNVLVPVNREIAYVRLRPYLPAEMSRLLEKDRERFEELFEGPATELETGIIDFHQFRLLMQPVLGIELDEDEFQRIWCDMFTVDEEMVALGEFLSGFYNTWLASNTSLVHYAWILERFPRVAFYRAAALSYELGAMKPAAAYYERAIDRLGIEPACSVFIDDIEENVAGAIRAGMHGIVFKNRQQLLGELQGRGITIPDKGVCTD